MTITREEIAFAIRILDPSLISDTEIYISNHFYELGRQKQRESDAEIAENDFFGSELARAIRNNTGDLT